MQAIYIRACDNMQTYLDSLSPCMHVERKWYGWSPTRLWFPIDLSYPLPPSWLDSATVPPYELLTVGDSLLIV